MAKPAKKIIEDPKRAKQLARAIASDIKLYNEQKIVAGIENDNLFDAMSGEITEGRELFRSRVTEDVFRLNLYDRAVVDGLLKNRGHLKSKCW